MAKFDSPAVESRSRQPAPPLVTRSDSSQQKSTIETGNAFSCIFRLSRQAAFAACKKAKQSNLTSPRGPKASRQKTFDLPNREEQTTCPERRVAARQVVLKKGHSLEGSGKSLMRTSKQAQTLERGASKSATRIRHDGQFEYGEV